MGILRFPWKSAPERPELVIGILAFEVAGLMSKLVNLWHSLSDKELNWLREQISDSVGVKRFVSEDEDYLMELALEEIVEQFGSLSKSVSRLSKRCKDPLYHRLQEFYEDPSRNDLHWFGWSYKSKKMDRKVKKIERFVSATTQLTHEQEVLVELEQTFRRMQVNDDRFDRVKLLEFQQKVMWQRQEVKTLRSMSPWGRSHDYVVRLMARSLFTVLERLKLVFGAERDCCSAKASGSSFRERRERFRVSRSKRLLGGSFSGGCVEARDSPAAATSLGGSMRLVPREPARDRVYSKLALFYSKSKSLSVRASTLGAAALALQYANVVKVVEKLASAPRLIGPDARDDLYSMLPTSIRSSLRSRLKSCAKTAGPCVYDPGLAGEWGAAVGQILEWLVPLAYSTLRWHSERSIEKQNEFARTNVLLVMTLYHADQAKVEAAITELLLGLNYMCRINGVDDAKMICEQAFS